MKPKRSTAVPLGLLLPIVAIGSGAAFSETSGHSHPFELPAATEALLDRYCYNCHDEETQKGDTRLDDLAGLDTGNRLDLLNRMQEQLYFQRMPPEDKRQPDEAERKAILAFVAGDLARHQASTLEGKLQKPEYGNYIDHEKLFSGEHRDLPGFTSDRRWLISEFIFSAC